MRASTSNHSHSTRTLASSIWAEFHNRLDDFPSTFNTRPLLQWIQDAVGDIEDTNGKRKASPASRVRPPSKRARTEAGLLERTQFPGLRSTGKDNYPTLPKTAFDAQPSLAEKQSLTPILNHSMCLHVTDEQSPANSRVAASTANRWDEANAAFWAYIISISETLSEPMELDLGSIRFSAFRGRLIAVMERDSPVDAYADWLFLVPQLNVDPDSYDYRANASDLLLSSYTLQRHGCARVQSNLKLIIQPGKRDGPDFLSLILDFTVLLSIPQALQPSPPSGATKKGTKGMKELVDVDMSLEDARRRVLRASLELEDIQSGELDDKINLSTFYSLIEPAPPISSKLADDALQPAGLKAKLLPFQRRTVAWLLQREGKEVTSDGRIIDRNSTQDFNFWTRVDEGNHGWYFNVLSGEIADELGQYPPIHGGILAEEPGLGKTLETISLALLNPAPPEWNPTVSRWDPTSKLHVKAVKTTLIVTPPSLSRQWQEEIATHAPDAKVFVYMGYQSLPALLSDSNQEAERVKDLKMKKQAKKRKHNQGAKAETVPTEDDPFVGSDGQPLHWPEFIQLFDFAIVDFSVLRHDLNIARPAPVRPRREDVSYATEARRRSPLVMVEWRRVVMDEVQMVGGGKTEEMVSLIPRLSSLAVSGTPVKTHVADLIKVLTFLRLNQLIGSTHQWKRLLKPGYSNEFATFLKQYAVRTMKLSINDELTIPRQTRYLVGIELGKVERHVYDQTLEGILLELGLDARGIASNDAWQLNGALLRNSLRRLRGICTHPQVGQLQRRDGLLKQGALKSMEAVLEAMRDQNWRNLMDDWKAKLLSHIRIARLQSKNERDHHRHRIGLESILTVEKEADRYLAELHAALEAHDAQGKVLRDEAAQLTAGEDLPEPKGKGKERAHLPDEDSDEEDDLDDVDMPKTPAGEEHQHKRRALRQRIREASLVIHQIQILKGDAYHVLAKQKEEDEAYALAEKIRRGLLNAPEREANKAMMQLQTSASRKGLHLEEILVETPYLTRGGIRSQYLFEELDGIIEETLNEQSKLLWKWREHVLSILTKPLNSDASGDADGQEYQRSLDDQGEAETYLQLYAALLADRKEALSSERTLLAAHDVREKRLRQTNAAIRAAAAAVEEEGDDIAADVEIQPEHDVLRKELNEARKALVATLKGRAVRSILVDLSTANTRITNDEDPEKLILKSGIENLRHFIADQNSLHDKLEADLSLIRKVFNQRILYFRQLQEISDSVAEVDWEDVSILEAIARCKIEQQDWNGKLNTMRARQRYLENLADGNVVGDGDDDEKACILCRCDFVRGYITQCAHIFCEECMKAWLTKESKTCPVCRVAIHSDTVQRFTISTDVAELPPKIVSDEPIPMSRRKIEYNHIDPTLFAQIQAVETYGDYGTKIQTLVRHLLYLKLSDPGSKSIVFSAWADSLHIVELALRQNGIRSLRIDQKLKNDPAPHIFRTDPDILVLLLHGERENAGLNVTCASRVFLLESVVHHSFEVQAIARIDRLGQRHETEVYCYYAEDTVERNILDLAARKGLSLYTKDNSMGTVNVSSFAKADEQSVDDPDKKRSRQKGDFIYKVEDMLGILFPHMVEELEYLLPPEAGVSTEVAPWVPVSDRDGDVEMAGSQTGSRQHEASTATQARFNTVARHRENNATAGPSRLG